MADSSHSETRGVGTLGMSPLFSRTALYSLAMPFLGIMEQPLSGNTRDGLEGAVTVTREGLASACREQSLLQLSEPVVCRRNPETCHVASQV